MSVQQNPKKRGKPVGRLPQGVTHTPEQASALDLKHEPQVTAYNESLRECLDRRDEMSAELRANLSRCFDKYGK